MGLDNGSRQIIIIITRNLYSAIMPLGSYRGESLKPLDLWLYYRPVPSERILQQPRQFGVAIRHVTSSLLFVSESRDHVAKCQLSKRAHIVINSMHQVARNVNQLSPNNLRSAARWNTSSETLKLRRSLTSSSSPQTSRSSLFSVIIITDRPSYVNQQHCSTTNLILLSAILHPSQHTFKVYNL